MTLISRRRLGGSSPSRIPVAWILVALAALAAPAQAAGERFTPADVFELEWASDPQLSPDGERVVFSRGWMDVMSDRRRSDLWLVEVGNGAARPLVTGLDASTPRWSPSGDRLLFVARHEGAAQLWIRWMDSGQQAPITRLTESPSNPVWSPDGRSIAFSMRVPAKAAAGPEMPPRPEGAEWAPPPKVIDKLIYRRDGGGYVEEGYDHLFMVPAGGGTPRQLTRGDFDHGTTAAWSADGDALIFSANRRDDWEYEPNDSEIWELELASGELRPLTDRRGPDRGPRLSPDGSRIAYFGFDDRYQGYQVTRLYVMDRDGSSPRLLSGELDRDVEAAEWADDGRSLWIRYDTEGNGKIGRLWLDGRLETLAGDVGGLSLGRPYASGQLSAAAGRVVYTHTRPGRPADLAVLEGDGPVRLLTALNEDLLGHKELAAVEEIWFESSHDGRRIQGWIAKPPGFDLDRDYPLILEIHGGPFADYGDRFAAEVELYAAAGYVVLYLNPRGSTSYGEAFGNLIHHAYPGDDYHDLMSGVDAVLARGYVDPERLFVTGGSGGGVLTAWIVGKTDRFRAAVSAKPVINWYSFALTADAYNFFYRYWFPGFPWDHPQEYLRRSPLSLVGYVSTPTMLLTGEEDFRTPMSESEQYYQALKLRKVPTSLVRIPGASHGIARRPSQLVAKVAHILQWFERWDAR